jgi:hypothetical protein
MSRVSLPGNDPSISEVVVGIDPMMECWFFQVWGVDPDTGLEDEPTVLNDSASRSEMVDAMNMYVDMTNERSNRAYGRIVMDIDPGGI